VGVKRRLTFYGWADTSEAHPFDRLRAAREVGDLDPDEVVLEQTDGGLTAVDLVEVGDADTPTRLLLHALHGPDSRPSDWGPGEGTRIIEIGEGRYTAFTSHVEIWPDKVAAIDLHANAPGLGRLSQYFWKRATERVAFRPLYRQDASERLRDLDGVRGFDFSIHEPHKVQQARRHGMLGSLLPNRDFPSIYVSAGMSRKQPKDAYVDDEVAQELFEIADSAEDLFDRIETGKKKSVRVNLLSERLKVEAELNNDRNNPSLPVQGDAFDALDGARAELQRDGELQAAVEARLALDAGD
jgi:hypothetical protein